MDAPERPPSPVENLEPWYSEDLERIANDVLARPLDSEDDLSALHALLGEGIDDVVVVLAGIANLEAEWRSEDRGRWFRWGVAELHAVRGDVFVYRTLLQRAQGKITRVQRDRNRRINAEQRRAKEERVQEKIGQLFTAPRPPKRDSRVADELNRDGSVANRARRSVLEAAFRLAGEPAEQWHPDSSAGLQLRGAIATYVAARDELRASIESESSDQAKDQGPDAAEGGVDPVPTDDAGEPQDRRDAAGG